MAGLEERKLLFIFGSHLVVPLLLVEYHQFFKDAGVMLFLAVTLQQMVFNLAPIPYFCINIGYLQPLLQILRCFFQQTLKKVKCLVCLACYQQDVSQVVEATNVVWILL
jgi:hypothetical protein